VVDLRSRTAFAAGHAPGTLNFGLDGGFATYLGWLVAWGTPITLLGETAEDVAEAQRELVRIGIDRPAAHATGGPEDWSDRELSSFATATFADLAQVRHHREVVVLDVRRADEHDAARIDGAVNIPLHELWDRLPEVPAGEVWVHCAGGYRASVAASMLDAAGRSLVAIDDSFDNAEQVGLHLVGPEA
jgi:hydroxyacylglutathione hydrolase